MPHTHTHTHLDALLFHSPYDLIESFLGWTERPSDQPGTGDVTHVAVVPTTCTHQHQFTSTDRDIGVTAIHSGGEGRGGEGRGGEVDQRSISCSACLHVVPTHFSVLLLAM